MAGCAPGKLFFRTGGGDDLGHGGEGGDMIWTTEGNDQVDARGGDDCVDLGPGNDVGQGGAGNDLILGGLGNDDLIGGTGIDRLRGDSGADIASGEAGDDDIIGESGRDRLFGGLGNDRILGGSGGDLISGAGGSDNISGESSDDALRGDTGADLLDGGSGSDRLSGGAGRDSLTGGADRDRISGGSAGDFISAHDGAGDRIDCGAGRDTVLADDFDRVSPGCERVRRSTVVARGSSPVGGRWLMGVYRSRGLPCIELTLLAPPPARPIGSAGQCGHFARAPGFGYSAVQVSDGKGRAEHLIFGRAPRRAAFVRMTAPGGLRRVVKTRPGPRGTRSDFWLIVAPPVHGEATLRWRAADRSTAGKPLHVPATRPWEYR